MRGRSSAIGGHGRYRSRAVEQILYLEEAWPPRGREGERRRAEEAWRASVRAYEEKRQRMARLEWHAFHADRPNATAPPCRR